MAGRFETVAGLTGHFHYADKKGYSGVGLYTRKKPSAVVTGIGNVEFDAEGRYVEARFDNARRKLSRSSAATSRVDPAAKSASTPSSASSR